MGDSIDPPSGAAQSAQSDTDIDPSDRRTTATAVALVPEPTRAHDPVTPAPPGLFARLKDAFFPPAIDPDGLPDQTGQAPARGVGLGNLRKMRVEDVAVPRVEIIAVPSDISLPDLVTVFQDSGLTRLPVYSRSLDTPIGLIHLKDLSLQFGFSGKPSRFSLKGLVRPLLFVPPSMPIGVLMQKMQSDRIHMALVIDEYGGVDGLLTIEDLIEQVVGEIEDEHDEPEANLWTQEKPGCYLAQARAPLQELAAELDLELSPEEIEEEIDTLGGLIFVLLGRVPARGEVIPHSSGAQFEIVEADPRRIKRIRVRSAGMMAMSTAAE